MRTNNTLTIKLLSDMCCGTGEGNGSNIDIKTSFDDNGLPIIPGKRLKGLLRECGKFIADNGCGDDSAVDRIFGKTGGNDGSLRIGTAQLVNSTAIADGLMNLHGDLGKIVTPKTVQSVFTVLRAQTAADNDGIVKPLSLRTLQLVRKKCAGIAIVFTTEISLDGNDKDRAFLEDCVKTLRHIGLNKSRGYGETECSLGEWNESGQQQDIKLTRTNKTVTVKYAVTLLDDLVIAAGSNENQEYISGAMLIGAFARYCKDFDWFNDVILRDTIFSNAYISVCDVKFQPTPLGLLHVKNDDGKSAYSLQDGFERDDNEQYVPFSGWCEIDGEKMITAKVKSALQYHNATKGANGADKQQLFTYRKILKGQTFSGTITADEGNIAVLRDVLADLGGKLYFGGSASAEYAECSFEFGQIVTQDTIIAQDKTIVEFLSDVIAIDEFGNNSCNIESLDKLVQTVVPHKTFKANTKTVTVGGYNAKWQLPKRQYTAFTKGTVLELTGATGQFTESGYIGLYTNEGYGQFRIRKLRSQKLSVSSASNTQGNDGIASEAIPIIKSAILNHLLEKYKLDALSIANDTTTNTSASSAMRLLSAYQLLQNKNDLKEKLTAFINKNFKDDLLTFTNKGIGSFDKVPLPSFEYAVDVQRDNANELFKEYIKAFINQVKRNYQNGGGQ
ncbi:hypothetical protein FACS1894105_00500 [Clostridia bacterium]|nr:hypothetical protein FACS1894105_00500 [Clostridia bacterium]